MREEDHRSPPDRSWIGMDSTGGFNYQPEQPSPEYDGSLTAQDKRNLWIFLGIVVVGVAACCGAGVAVGVFFA